MFLCNSQTERECLGRMLFGSPSAKWNEVSKITNRTAIFLYTLGQYPMVRGIFVAQKPPFYDCSGPYKGKFPAQVRVSWYHKFHPMPSGYFEFEKLFGGDGNRERKLSKSQTQGIIASFVDHIWRTEVLAQLSLVKSQPPTVQKAAARKGKVEVRGRIFVNSRMLKAEAKKAIQVTPGYMPNANVLLFDGRPIPVYNPRGVYPVIRALPPLQPRVTSGFNMSALIPRVNYYPYPKMTLHPMFSFRPVQMQTQRRILPNQQHLYPVGRHRSSQRSGQRNRRMKSQSQ